MSLPLSFYKSTMAGSFAAGAAPPRLLDYFPASSGGVETPMSRAVPATFTQQVTANFMAPAKKEFSMVAFLKDLAVVSNAPAPT